MPLLAPSRAGILSTAAHVVAASTCVLSVLAFGAVHPVAVVAAFALATVAVALLLVSKAASGRRMYLSILGLPFAVGVVWTTVSLTPLPEGLRAAVDADLVEQTRFLTALLAPEAKAQVRGVMHADPPEGALALLRLCTALMLFVVVADGSRKRDVQRLHQRTVLVGGALLLAVAVVHPLLGLDKVYGMYTPRPTTLVYGPLLNPNHLARALGFFSLMAFAQYIRASRADERWQAAAVTLGCGLAVPLTLSRGGTMSFAVVSVATLLWARRMQQQRDEDDNLGPSLGRLAIVAIVLTAAVAALTATEWEQEWLQTKATPDAKTIPWGMAWRLLQAHPWGIGNGGFASLHPTVIDNVATFGQRAVSHPENVVLSTLVSHGWLGGALVIAAALAAVVIVANALRLGHQRALVGGALLFLLVADLGDFALDVGFGLFLAAWALGLAAAPVADQPRRTLKLKARQAWLPVAAVVVLGALTLPMVLQETRYTQVKRLRTAADTSPASMKLQFEAGVASHPHDGWFALGRALQAQREGKVREQSEWLRRALVAHPALPDAHLAYARMLANAGQREQALLEYGIALRSPFASIVREMVALSTSYADFEGALAGKPNARVRVCAELRRAQAPLDDVLRCHDDVTRTLPHRQNHLLQVVDYALRKGDVDEAAARLRHPGVPADGRADVLQLRILEVQQGRSAAIASGVKMLAERPSHPLAWWHAQKAMADGQLEVAQTSLTVAERHAPRGQKWRVALLSARLSGRRKDLADAWSSFDRALRRAPGAQQQSVLLEMVTFAHKEGLHAQRDLALRKARALGSTPKLRAVEKALSNARAGQGRGAAPQTQTPTKTTPTEKNTD